MEKLPYICGRKANRPVTYRNNIYGTFRKKVCRTKTPIIYLYYPIKTLNVKIDDVINGNDISTYGQAHGGNGEHKKLSMVITT